MSSKLSPDQLISSLNSRYATKQFNPQKKIDASTWATLEQALILSPSSYGLQPYRFMIVQNPELRKQLRAHSWNQSQVEDCSHYVVFTARKQVTEATVQDYIKRISDIRGVPLAQLQGYQDMMTGDLVKGPRSKISQDWATRQAYIALGGLLTAAALLNVDACPMEGFDPAQYDQILNLKNSEFTSVVTCALGFRSEADVTSQYKKVRQTTQNLIIYT